MLCLNVYAIRGDIERVVVLRFKFKTDLLAGLNKAIEQETIKNAVILAGAGSVRGYHYHSVSNRDFPSKKRASQGPDSPRGHPQHERLYH